ncbi:MAG: tRNA uridine-5-carboxymethylaminomethyl(34) synthesis enzyme MnmG, partial [Burkholderiales bacterium]|nr:tRNA uridine-5-carboxymethylaminomethyl(34) synthesis enzyme MnmG [Burkholderiales bacterium]
EMGRELGLIGDAQWEAFCKKRDAIDLELERLRTTWVNPRILAVADAERVLGKAIEREYTLADLLRRPQVSYDSLMSMEIAKPAVEDPLVAEQVEIQLKYQGYIERQQSEVANRDNLEEFLLPADLDFTDVSGLSKEVQQKLIKHKPETMGQVSRISGITPAAIALMLVHLKKKQMLDARKVTE